MRPPHPRPDGDADALSVRLRAETAEVHREAEQRPFMKTFFAGQLSREDVKAVQLAVIAHCEKMKDRFAILDCLPDLNVQQMDDWRMKEAGYDSQFAAMYYPWIWVANPMANGSGPSPRGE